MGEFLCTVSEFVYKYSKIWPDRTRMLPNLEQLQTEKQNGHILLMNSVNCRDLPLIGLSKIKVVPFP